MNILWVDVETTGLDKHRNGIIQLAGMVEVDGDVDATFDLRMNPEAEFDPTSQEIHGISEEQIAEYPSKEETFERFKSLLLRYVRPEDPATRLYPGGYNVRFDLGFIDTWFRGQGEGGLSLYLQRERIDPSMMMKSFQDYLGKGRMPSWSLRSVATQMGLSYGVRHDAFEDIDLTRSIHHRILSFFPNL